MVTLLKALGRSYLKMDARHDTPASSDTRDRMTIAHQS
jgi:hypothetical protein